MGACVVGAKQQDPSECVYETAISNYHDSNKSSTLETVLILGPHRSGKDTISTQIQNLCICQSNEARCRLKLQQEYERATNTIRDQIIIRIFLLIHKNISKSKEYDTSSLNTIYPIKSIDFNNSSTIYYIAFIMIHCLKYYPYRSRDVISGDDLRAQNIIKPIMKYLYDLFNNNERRHSK